MSSLEQAYIDALRTELARAQDAAHAAEIKAELARVGAPVVETAAAAPKVQTAAAPKKAGRVAK